MQMIQKFAWAAVVGCPILVGILVYFSPATLLGSQEIDLSIGLSIIGIGLSYFGLVFSFYAAVKVKSLSQLHFFKIRSPEVAKKLNKLSKSYSDFGSEPSLTLMAQSFIAESPVALRSAKRINNKNVEKIAEQAELSFKKLKASMKSDSADGVQCGEISNYWEFYQAISELLDELNVQIEEVRASA